MDDFAKLSAEERKPYFEAAAASAGSMGEHIIEKDFWVCWTLKRLFTLPLLDDHLIFKGGTSLSKVFNVIERFSEDIDLSVSKELLGFGDNKDPEKATGSKQRNKRVEELAEACADFVKTRLHGELGGAIKTALGTGKGWKLQIDPDDGDGQTLLFEFPPSESSRAGYIRPMVKIEIGARSDHWPAHQHEVHSYLAEYVRASMKTPGARVKTLDAARTFWEKATILHSYAHFPETKTPAARQSRHYYDLHRLLQTKHKKEATDDIALLERVAEHKSIYFRAGWAKYDEARKGSLRLVPGERVADLMRKDYEQMQEMIFGEAPTWADITAAIKKFEAEFNA